MVFVIGFQANFKQDPREMKTRTERRPNGTVDCPDQGGENGRMIQSENRSIPPTLPKVQTLIANSVLSAIAIATTR